MKIIEIPQESKDYLENIGLVLSHVNSDIHTPNKVQESLYYLRSRAAEEMEELSKDERQALAYAIDTYMNISFAIQNHPEAYEQLQNLLNPNV